MKRLLIHLTSLLIRHKKWDQDPPVNNNGGDRRIVLPRFKPESASVDPVEWCATAEMCLDENQREGSALVSLLSDAFEGSSSGWLSQVCFTEMKWAHFK